jgi:hypothetical protein
MQNEAELAQLQELYDTLQLEHQRAQATPFAPQMYLETCRYLVSRIQNEAELAQLQELYDTLQLEHQRAQATPFAPQPYLETCKYLCVTYAE